MYKMKCRRNQPLLARLCSLIWRGAKKQLKIDDNIKAAAAGAYIYAVQSFQTSGCLQNLQDSFIYLLTLKSKAESIRPTPSKESLFPFADASWDPTLEITQNLILSY